MSLDHLMNQIVDEFHGGLIPGWCPLEKALDLAAIVAGMRPKVIVEIGVYGGKSLIPMALACKAVGGGLCIGIDPWDSVASTEGYTGANAEWWGDLNHHQIMQGFLDNVKRLDLGERIAVTVSKSDDAVCPAVLDVAHLDGQHTEQAIRDVMKFGSRIRIGGIVCMDDLHWTNDGVPHVEQAVTALIGLGFTELYRRETPIGSWGFFQRISLPPAVSEVQPTRKTQAMRPVAKSSKRKARK